MTPYVWLGLVTLCLVVSCFLLLRPLRHAYEDHHVDKARDLFRPQREGLEARFLGVLTRIDPVEALRWEDATWQDEVVWARDRRTRRLLALVGVRFLSDPFLDPLETSRPQSTALFEFRKGQWHAEGKRLDEVGPAEACRRNSRYEPVVMPQRRP